MLTTVPVRCSGTTREGQPCQQFKRFEDFPDDGWRCQHHQKARVGATDKPIVSAEVPYWARPSSFFNEIEQAYVEGRLTDSDLDGAGFVPEWQ